MRLDTALEMIPGLVIGLTLHECAHALTASWLGDRYAASQGRISLNPFRHLSFWGTLALFVLGFGWGKPVPINLYNFRHPKRDFLLTSLAGPASNLLLCAISLGLMYLPIPRWLFTQLFFMCGINGLLALVNLIPIPPLDGSRIWPCVIPGMKPVISGKWSVIWLILLVYVISTHKLDAVINPIIYHTRHLLPIPSYIGQERPDKFPPELQIPANSMAWYRAWPKESADPNLFEIHSFILEPFPPERWMAFVRDPLQQQGWKSCTSENIDQNLAIESKWVQITEPDGRTAFNWTEAWFHPQRGLVMIYIHQSVSHPNNPHKLNAGNVRIEMYTPEYGDYRELLQNWHKKTSDPPQEKIGS
jgi:Zn-dependent protease